MAAPSTHELISIAEAFHGQGAVHAVEPLGNGHVNDTYLVRSGQTITVMQRLNTTVFRQPHLVMQNLQTLADHVEVRLRDAEIQQLLGQRRWQVPRVICTREAGKPWHCCPHGDVWRTISFVPDTTCVDVAQSSEQARELGIGLGLFHLLISDLPTDHLADTLEGFHITPGYLAAYHQARLTSNVPKSSASEHCMAFIQEREEFCTWLELAKQNGELPLRPIHGDPKINNVLLDRTTGQAVALIDLDTVKPGLVHYDIGDCLRSCCNRLGEDTQDIAAVSFDLELADALITGYLGVAGSFLSAAELTYIPDAARLLSFELGLRFFTDHLQGNTYFKASRPDHNLERALVQFQLTASIEAQLPALRQIVERHAALASL